MHSSRPLRSPVAASQSAGATAMPARRARRAAAGRFVMCGEGFEDTLAARNRASGTSTAALNSAHAWSNMFHARHTSNQASHINSVAHDDQTEHPRPAGVAEPTIPSSQGTRRARCRSRPRRDVPIAYQYDFGNDIDKNTIHGISTAAPTRHQDHHEPLSRRSPHRRDRDEPVEQPSDRARSSADHPSTSHVTPVP